MDSCWSEEPLTFTFFSEDLLKEFCCEAEKLQRKLLQKHLYDSVSSFIYFYREYKAGDTPMPDFYYNHSAVYHPDSPCCVGNAILLRDELLNPESYFMNQYPNLERYLYFASSNISSYRFMEKIPGDYLTCPPPFQSIDYKEHVLVTLKISLNGRDGYVLMDIGYQLSAPVVVMADEKPPHTQPFVHYWAKGAMQYSYALEGNYIHWRIRTGDAPEPKVNHRWIYVAKTFTKLQEAEKKTRVDDFHAMVTRGFDGPQAGIYLVYGRHDCVFVYIRRTEGSVIVKVPFEHLLMENDDSYEDIIRECAAKMNLDKEKLKETMKSLAEIQADKTFFEPMMKIQQEQTSILETCWEKEKSGLKFNVKNRSKTKVTDDNNARTSFQGLCT